MNKNTFSIEEFSNIAIKNNLNRLCNNIYKLLPMKEEGQNWTKPLETVIVEVAGYSSFVDFEQEKMLMLLGKLQGLVQLQDEIDFSLYRRTIFECCNIVNKMQEKYSPNEVSKL